MNNIQMCRISPLLLCTALLANPLLADVMSGSSDCVVDIAETTSSRAFTVLEGGAVVRHESTGLEWQRCAEGMSWTGSGCSGNAQTFSWRESLQRANSRDGWRLPNIKELRSIVERCRIDPAINQQVFPNTPSTIFWSASPTPSVPHAVGGWHVGFYEGVVGGGLMSNSNQIRLVRDGQ